MSRPACLTLIAVLLVCLYQAYRGFMFQLIRTDSPFGGWPRHRRLLLLALADGFFYFVTTASGFAAMAKFVKLLHQIKEPGNISAGTAAFLSFLALYGVLGITAQLPFLIQRGRLPFKI